MDKLQKKAKEVGKLENQIETLCGNIVFNTYYIKNTKDYDKYIKKESVDELLDVIHQFETAVKEFKNLL